MKRLTPTDINLIQFVMNCVNTERFNVEYDVINRRAILTNLGDKQDRIEVFGTYGYKDDPLRYRVVGNEYNALSWDDKRDLKGVRKWMRNIMAPRMPIWIPD